MKLHLGEVLKKLRVQKGITQEKLAEQLGVSCQSVSRWELGICYPDLELLPAIANYFEVTVDTLLGMGQLRSEEQHRRIFTEAIEYERQGEWGMAAALLREALQIYPADCGLQTELAMVLTNTGLAKDKEEAITLLETVLQNSTNEKVRSTARASLCFLYKAVGRPEKAVSVARTLPHIWESREMLLPFLVAEEEHEQMLRRSMNIAIQVLRDVAAGRAISFSLGYAPEEAENEQSFMQYLRSME